MDSNVFQALQVIIQKGAHFEAISTLISDVERQYGLAMDDINTLKTKLDEIANKNDVKKQKMKKRKNN